MALNPRQQMFVKEYLIDLNATAAYKRAGYKARGAAADTNASRLLKNAEIATAVQAGMDKRATQTGISPEYVLSSIKRIAEAAELADDRAAALKGHELLGKHLRLFTDKVEHSGKVEHVEIVVK